MTAACVCILWLLRLCCLSVCVPSETVDGILENITGQPAAPIGRATSSTDGVEPPSVASVSSTPSISPSVRTPSDSESEGRQKRLSEQRLPSRGLLLRRRSSIREGVDVPYSLSFKESPLEQVGEAFHMYRYCSVNSRDYSNLPPHRSRSVVLLRKLLHKIATFWRCVDGDANVEINASCALFLLDIGASYTHKHGSLIIQQVAFFLVQIRCCSFPSFFCLNFLSRRLRIGEIR